jgi:hypothetical protein
MTLLSFGHKSLSPLFPRGEDGLRVHLVTYSCNLQSCRYVLSSFLNYYHHRFFELYLNIYFI